MTHFRLIRRLCMGLLLLAGPYAFSQQFEPRLTLSISDFMKWDRPGPDLIGYKNSNHKLAVGYFNGLTRVTAPDYYSLRDVPDSVDIVNLFHRFVGLGNLRRGERLPGATGEDARTLTEIIADIRYLKTKGTRVVETQFVNEIFDSYKDAGKTAKWQNTPEDYDGYAKQVLDSLTAWGIDGIDLDIEYGFSTTGLTKAQVESYVNAFAKYFGPTSASKKLLIIDTNIGLAELGFSMETINKLDYIYIQDYFGSTASSDDKIDGYVAAGFPKERIMLISADFESSYTSTSTGSGPPRLKKYYTDPKYLAKVGGYGAYGFNFDKKQDYRYYREMIQTLNPAGTVAVNPLVVPENVSRVPLAPRQFVLPSQLNPKQSFTGKINYSPDGMDIWAAYTKEQNKFNMYNFTHWQYIDVLTWFTGQIGIPGRPWIETAHKNGVKIIGSVFPRSSAENAALLQKDSEGKYIGARKLVEVANYYGFDGWFFNIESSANGAEMMNFLKELQRIKPEGMEIHWYDAMVPAGYISYQNELNSTNAPLLQDGAERVSDAMFTNYWWGQRGIETTEATAAAIGRSPFDVYTGADLWPGRFQQAMFSNNTWIDDCFTNGDPSKPRTSIALFATNLTYNSGLANFNNDPGDYANFYKVEARMFAGDDLNSTTTETSGWKGFGHYIPVRTSVTTLPFVTYFNVGQGKIVASNGRKVAKDWTDMGKQDIMPSWQWAITGDAPLSASFDFDEAYSGGTSIKLAGSLQHNGATIKLYQTKLTLAADSKFDLIYKQAAAGASRLKLALYFSDNLATPVYLAINDATDAEWHIQTLDLAPYAGKELAIVGLAAESPEAVPDYAVNIGGIRIYNGTSLPGLPVPEFSASQTSVILGDSVTYANGTKNATSFTWTFEGGTPATSNEVNPVVSYKTSGTFAVTLTATNGNGTETLTKSGYITVTAPPPPANRSLVFDGADQYLNAGTMQLSGTALTLEGWVKPAGFKDAFPYISTMMGIEGGALLRFGDAGVPNNKLQFASSVGSLVSSTTFETGKWYHIAATYDGAVMKIYVNGVLDASVNRAGSLNANGDFNISYSYNASRGFNGGMDELRVWKKALTQAEIQANMCDIAPDSPALEAYWKCDEGIGTSTRDLTGHGHNARLMQMGMENWSLNVPSCAREYFVYRSAGEVDLASIANWEVYDGTSWIVPSGTNPPPAGKATSVLIREGHKWNNNLAATTIPAGTVLTDSSAAAGTFSTDNRITNLGTIVMAGKAPQTIPSPSAFEGSHWGNVVVANAAGVSTPQSGMNTARVNNLELKAGILTVTSDTRASLAIEGTVTAEAGKLAVTGTGTSEGVHLSGSAAQVLPAGMFVNDQIARLVVNNPAGVTVNGALTVSGELTLSNGNVTLAGGTLAAGRVSGAGADKFIITGGNSGFKMAAGSTVTSFPVGASAGSYTPVTIDNTAGTPDSFTVSVQSGLEGVPVAEPARVVPVLWNVTEGVPGGSAAILTFQWNAGDAAGATGFTPGSSGRVIGHYTGGKWEKQLAAIEGTGPYMATNATPYTTFSPFAVGMDGALDGSALPLRLVSFTGNRENGANNLTWITAEETNVSHFEVERSANGRAFAGIGRVSAHNRTEGGNYRYGDVKPLPGKGYYRLKMVDLDGSSTYSGILVLEGTGRTSKLGIYPNPGTGLITLEHDRAGKGARITVTALDGRELSATPVEPGAVQTQVDISRLQAGVYLVSFVNDGTRTYSRLVK